MKHTNKMRVSALFLAAVMLAFSACAKTSASAGAPVQLDAKNPVSLRMWHYYNGLQKSALDEMVAEFNDSVGSQQGIVVEAFSHGSIADLTENVLDAVHKKVGAEQVPEIFAAYADTAYQVDQLNMVADLSPYITQEELAAYVPGYIAEGRLGNAAEFKIFPVAKSTEIMMLNKTDWTVFADETGAKLEDLATMEGLVAVAKTYYEWTDAKTPTPNDGKAFWGRDSMANYFIIGAKQLGVVLFDVKDDVVTFHLDKAVLRTLWDNYYVPSVEGWFGAYGRFRSDDAKTGDILALVGSSSGAAYFPDSVTISDTESYPIEALSLPAPRFRNGEKVAVQQGAGMVVTKSTPQKEYAASIFLKWMTEEARNINFSISSGYLPVKTAANDSAKIAQAIQTMAADESVRKLATSMPVAIETVLQNELYTNTAFAHGFEARNLLEHSLSDKLKQDLTQIDAQMQTGVLRSEAAAQYETDENFDAWYESFSAALYALQ